jgi:hypothetical protein
VICNLQVNTVAKASSPAFQWRYFLSVIQNLPLTELANDVLKQFPPVRRWSGPGGWLLVLTGAVAMLYWNGRLVLATGAGMGVMMLIYLLHDWKLKLPVAGLRKAIDELNHPLILAIAGGGVATLTTYLAASIWVDSDSPWIALGALLQGAGTLSVLVLLAWQILNRQAGRDRLVYDRVLADLTHEDSLRRLMSVRQLTSMVPDMGDNAARRKDLGDYFRLMLSREAEPIVREAVFEGLQALEQVQPLKQATQPLVSPTEMKRHGRSRSRQRVPVRSSRVD